VSRRTPRIALLACAFAVIVPALASALVRAVPASTAAALLGPKMIRAEIGVQPTAGPVQDFRIDRGRLSKRYSGGQLVLVERDSNDRVTLKISPAARVLLDGKFVALRSLRPGMQLAVPRQDSVAADVVYAGRKSAPPIPKATVLYMLGGRMLRAEIAYMDTVLHDYLLDRGRIRQLGPYSLTLRELDGTTVTFGTSASVRVKLNGKTASFAQLRKGMTATVMRDGEKAPDQIWATGK
jgi:hypothetical protein